MTTPPPDPPRPPRRRLVAALVAGLVVLAAVVVVVLQRDPEPLDPATPAGTVQAWLQSVVDGVPRDDLLDPASDCPTRGPTSALPDDVRAVLGATTRDGDRASVTLRVTEGASGLFDDGSTVDAEYRLRRADGGWVISAYEWPWDACWYDADGGA